jgi:hypothetical protein
MDIVIEENRSVIADQLYGYKKYFYTWLVFSAVMGVIAVGAILVNNNYNKPTIVHVLNKRANHVPCSNNSQCNNGECVPSTSFNESSGVCKCDKFYVNHKGGVCNYEMRPKLNTFLASFLGGCVGADWFYLSRGNGGYIVAGVFKLLTFGGLGIWATVDWIRVLCDAFKDGNGIVPTVWA